MLFVVLVNLLALSLGDANPYSTKLKPPPPSELQIEVLQEGEKCEPGVKLGNKVGIHYTGRLYTNDRVFDSSFERAQPYEFYLGFTKVLKGWEEGLIGMCPGEKRRLTVPPELGYGKKGIPGSIPGNATLIYDIELVWYNKNSNRRRKTAQERIEAKKKEERRLRAQANLRGEEAPGGGRMIQKASLGGDDDDDDEEDDEL
ncbi:putative peptidyl-prolyl cis-trans isomerase FKBP15-1 [Monocercomonoides exilis]|uniref:putative peptidyl-prolyl cis-trans isomerase FKBP15-1 n=1 Tax=Monocercomonoides exilis TaxID=2049356 RepID=UPI00355A4708|nr:putative peptidyl-prolyl cis-trans isomerase FKBP15-1 [Monocercomonoides exilis]|eukprot:MONOS_6398.1-p1 / transcript=MONOS_6398.1 / gene=MONOS_6398 / organism=Monocercomonoides_exilis_PA203 / gene_product=RecName / transcript_product=RecName / location=Mono_scaffold00201:24452-25180(+) / protein_length=200 / sequence_SO=supercontig / SO=protein_coding / is_pseudo=false